MALKKKYTDKKDIPAGLAEHYVEKDGAWILATEGADDDAPDKSKVAEMRARNIELERQVAEAKAQIGRYKDLDPAKAREALATLEEMRTDQELASILGEKADVASVKAAAKRLATQIAQSELAERQAQVQAAMARAENAEKAHGELRARYSATALSTGLSQAIDSKGLKLQKGAAQVLEVIAGRNWNVKDDGTFESRGVFGKDAQPIKDLADYVPILQRDHPFLFEPAQGGNAPGSNGAPSSGLPSGVSMDPHSAGTLLLPRDKPPGS
jgi:hypothetical protein